jgi:hypothetical protein
MKKTSIIILLMMIILSCSVLAVVNNAGVYYSFDTNTSNVYDWTGNNNTGTISNAVYLPSCVIGGCFNYTSAIMGMVTPDNATSFNPSLNFTFTFWIKKLNTDIGLFYKGLSTGNNFQVGVFHAKLYIYSKASTYGNEYADYGSVIPNSTWTHITIIRSVYPTGLGTNFTVYINGNFDYTKNYATGVGSVSTTESFKIDEVPALVGNTINSAIDELAFYNYSFNSSQPNESYFNGLNKTNPYNITITPAVVNITFINQTPNNITTLNIIGNPLMIYYNINNTGKNHTSPRLIFNLSNAYVYVNGTNTNGQGNKSYFNKTSNNITYSFLLSDNNVYPATYNIDEEVMESTPHTQYVTTSNNEEMKVSMLNVSTSKNYNIFEVFANVNTTGSVRVYYCNNTYVSGNPSSDNNCVQFGTINGSGFNHTHQYSRHNLLAMNMFNGTIGGIIVTPLSYFIFDRAVGGMQIGYINGSPRLNTTMTTTNSGLSWTNQNWTADMHIHQYDGSEILNYYMCYNITNSVSECSSIVSQSIGLSILPPTSPVVIINKYDYFYNETMNINFTNSTPFNTSTTITNYNITIYDTIGNYYLTINNSGSTNQSFLVKGLKYGIDYVIRVTAKDSNNNYAYGESNIFNVHNKINSPCNISITMNNSGVPVLFDFLTDNNSLYNQIIGRKGIIIDEFLSNTTGLVNIVNLSGTYILLVNSSYSGSSTQETTSCYLDVCTNSWNQNLAGCIGNLKLITYTDTNNCAYKYDIPSDNGTYEACSSPANTDKDLWFIILLLVIWVISLIVTISLMPIMGILSFLTGLGLMYYANLYFGNPFLGLITVILSVVAIIIGVKLKT